VPSGTCPGSEAVRLAVVQVRDVPAEVPARAAHCLKTMQVCADDGADLVLFPELYLGGYVLDPQLALKASQVPRALARLQAAVDELGVSAVLGLPYLRAEALLNAVAVLRPGHEPAVVGKTHLFQAEEQWFAAARELWTGRLADWQAGLVVCYELGFPEISRVLALRGARLLLAPAAFGAAREHIWRTATVSRALENGCYLAAANTAGPGQRGDYLGMSRIVDPRGTIIAEAGDGDEVLMADLDAALVEEVRGGDRGGGGHTYFRDRRPALYEDVCRIKAPGEAAPEAAGD
jgi:predicted amidohydrolase